MISPTFHRLIRFADPHDEIYYGEVTNKHSWAADLVGITVNIYEGNDPWEPGFRLSEQQAKIASVLSPIASTPMVYGVGLNYRRHAEEAKFPIPAHPVVFVKGPDSLANPYEDIPINKEARNLDYEGELCVVIGEDIKDLPDSGDPLSYVLGYTVGNDISSRYWQDAVRAGNQHGYAKAFDKFGPLGPVLCSPAQIPDPASLKLRTRVNGELRQETPIDDLIFDVRSILRHLSMGRTLRRGTVIMTGTPSGVAAFQKPVPLWLKDGDIVEVEIEGIGKIRNRMTFET